jgi:hypothetical protein
MFVVSIGEIDWLVLVLQVREVAALNLYPETRHFRCYLFALRQYFRGNSEVEPEIWTRPRPSATFPIRYSLPTLSFHSLQSVL